MAAIPSPLERGIRVALLAAAVPLTVWTANQVFHAVTKTRVRLNHAVEKKDAADLINFLFESKNGSYNQLPSRGFLLKVCQALETISSPEDVALVTVPEEVYDRIAELLKRFIQKNDTEAIAAVLLLVYRTSFSNRVCKDRYGKLGISRMALEAVRTHHLVHRNVALRGAAAITHLAAWNEAGNRNLLNEQGACELMVEMLDGAQARSDTAVARATCEAIRVLNDEARLVKSGAFEVLTTALLAFGQSDASVAAEACAGMGRLLNYDSARAFEERRIHLDLQLGACEGLVGALGTFGTSAVAMVEEACPVVSALCRHSDGAQNKERLGLLGMCDVLVGILASEEASWDLNQAWMVSRACTAMADLAENCPENRRRLREVGACEVAVDVLRVFAERQIPDVAPVACSLVLTLIGGDEEQGKENRTRLEELGVVEAVRATHKDNVNKQRTLKALGVKD